jgi:hypothetical protein
MKLLIGEVFLFPIFVIDILFIVTFSYSYKYKADYVSVREIDNCMPSNINNIKFLIKNIYYETERKYGRIEAKSITVTSERVIIYMKMRNGEFKKETLDIKKYIDKSLNVYSIEGVLYGNVR